MRGNARVDPVYTVQPPNVYKLVHTRQIDYLLCSYEILVSNLFCFLICFYLLSHLRIPFTLINSTVIYFCKNVNKLKIDIFRSTFNYAILK